MPAADDRGILGPLIALRFAVSCFKDAVQRQRLRWLGLDKKTKKETDWTHPLEKRTNIEMGRGGVI